jgi:6-pyruvoyl-tetrahydropterin synthase
MQSIRASLYVSVAHRYWNGQWSREKNEQIYGRDASSEGLGGNLRLEALAEAGDGETESQVRTALARVKDLLDHQCLFTHWPRFHQAPSTVENMADHFAAELFAAELSHGRWQAFTVWETDAVGSTRFFDGACELHVKTLNLTLNLRGKIDSESGLIADRARVRETVRETFLGFGAAAGGDPRSWGHELFSILKQSLRQLHSLRVDLGRHEYLLIPENV